MSTTVHLPNHLLESVDSRASELGVSRNRYIIRALERSLDTETRWSDRFVETLAEARPDEEARLALEETMAAVAAHRTLGATLVTDNLDHMQRIPNLHVDNWHQRPTG